MKRVTDFLMTSNLTDDVILLDWLDSEVRNCLASLFTVSSKTLFQSTGLFTNGLEMKAEGKGERSFFALSNDSAFGC